MRRVPAVLVALLFTLSLSGCIVHTHDGHHGRSRSRVTKRSCHPSQYWDGHTCRHKGKGHGARKHDGRR